MATDPKFVSRIACITLSCAINLILLSLVMCKIYWKKEKPYGICFKLLMIYLFFGFFTPFYNIIYRFIIQGTETQCLISDSIEEVLVIVTRGVVLLFYVIRLKTIFKGASGEISDRRAKILIIIMVSYSIIIPSLWIPTQQVTPYITDDFGVYCSNTGDLLIILAYYLVDFIFTLVLTWMYVYRLYKLSKHSVENKQKKLIEIVKKTIILTIISLISTWVIMYPSYLSTSDFLSELRWFYPLDYGINGLCLFFMFKWDICSCCSTKEENLESKHVNNQRSVAMNDGGSSQSPKSVVTEMTTMDIMPTMTTMDVVITPATSAEITPATTPRGPLPVLSIDNIMIPSNSVTDTNKSFRSIAGIRVDSLQSIDNLQAIDSNSD